MRKKVVALEIFCFLPYDFNGLSLTMYGEYHRARKMIVLKICPDFAQSKSLFNGLLFLEPCNDLS